MGSASKFITIVLLLAFALAACAPPGTPRAQPTAAQPAPGAEGEIALPAPRLDSDVSLEETLRQRRSMRAYTNEPLTLVEIGQLFWAAQGVITESGLRTAPSAGALYIALDKDEPWTHQAILPWLTREPRRVASWRAPGSRV
jgi:hypothetical protein